MTYFKKQNLFVRTIGDIVAKYPYDGEFDFAAKSKLAKNNLYLRENKCFPSQRYKECTLIPLAV